MNTSEARWYDLRNLRESNEVLDSLGARVYFLQGWEFFSVLLGNIDYFRQQPDERWVGACEAGQARSAKFNNFATELGLAMADVTELGTESGVNIWNLVIGITEGKTVDNTILPANASLGFNRVAFFVRTENLDKNQLLTIISKSLESAQRHGDGKQIPAAFFIIEADEGEIDQLIASVRRKQATGLNTREIASQIEKENNPIHGRVNFDSYIES